MNAKISKFFVCLLFFAENKFYSILKRRCILLRLRKNIHLFPLVNNKNIENIHIKYKSLCSGQKFPKLSKFELFVKKEQLSQRM